jgi:hypothetical protein
MRSRGSDVVLYDANNNPLLGQAASALSIPVTMASDQSPSQIAGIDSGAVKRTILTDTTGRIIVAPAGASASVQGFSNGDVVLAALTTAAVRRTTFVEQAANAQRSFSSASANDIAAGTGARTIQLTYYTATFTGPFTETITLNGTTAVNTVSTTICYVESIITQTVGSGLVNAGIITMFAAAAAGGGAIGTIGAGDNRTFWAHHYIATGKTCFVTGLTGSENNASNAGQFFLRAKTLGVANAAEIQISDYVRALNSATITRNYGTPLQVVGPARITAYVLTEGTPSITYRSSFDFYDQ